MKKIILILLNLICASPALALTQTLPGGNAMLPMPTEEEMQEIQKFLDTLSPEELDELAKIGEEIIQTAEKEGRPLFGPSQNTQPITMPKPQPVKSTSTTQKTKPQESAKPKERILSSKEKARIQRILSGLVESIASIRQKATSDEILIQLLSSLNANLNDLTYYLNVVNYSKHLVRLTDKEFTPLNENLRKLYEEVDEIDSKLDVPEAIMNKKQSSDDLKKQRKKIKDAAKLLDKFTSIMNTAIKQKHVLTDLERLVKKYEPEALKIKKEQEEKEKKANAQRTNLPVTNVPQVYKSPTSGRGTQNYTGRANNRRSYGGSNYNPSMKPGGRPMNYPGGSSKPFGGSAGTTAAGAKKADNNISKDQKKKEEVKTATPASKATEAEKTYQLEEKIKGKMEEINYFAGSQRDKLNSLIDEYLPSPDAVIQNLSNDYTGVIESISFDLGRMKKDIVSWVSKIHTQATGREEYTKHRNRLKTYMDDSMKDIEAFYKKAKSNSGLLSGTSPRVNEHKQYINQLIKHVDDIKKELTKPA